MSISEMKHNQFLQGSFLVQVCLLNCSTCGFTYCIFPGNLALDLSQSLSHFNDKDSGYFVLLSCVFVLIIEIQFCLSLLHTAHAVANLLGQ